MHTKTFTVASGSIICCEIRFPCHPCQLFSVAGKMWPVVRISYLLCSRQSLSPLPLSQAPSILQTDSSLAQRARWIDTSTLSTQRRVEQLATVLLYYSIIGSVETLISRKRTRTSAGLGPCLRFIYTAIEFRIDTHFTSYFAVGFGIPHPIPSVTFASPSLACLYLPATGCFSGLLRPDGRHESRRG